MPDTIRISDSCAHLWRCGFLIGIGIAAWIGRVNFHAAVVPRFSVLPVVLAGSMAVTLLSAILPISLLGRVQPAVILRGE